MQRIKQGDEVVVICGASKGTRGQVERIIYNNVREATHVVVAGVNMTIRHERPNPAKGSTGGRVSKEAPVHVSNVALYDEKRSRGSRVRVETDEEGGRHRAFVGGGRAG